MELVIKERKCSDILTPSGTPLGGYSVNPYVGCTHKCKYCYASFMKRFTKHSEEWGTFLDVKYWPEFSARKLSKLEGQHILIGSVTDGYLPEEEKYLRTQHFLKEVQHTGANITICTKSDLVLRDIEILKNFKGNVTVSFSINTIDECFRGAMDRAVTIKRRFNAMKNLYDEGIRTVCFISPIFPWITDIDSIISRAKDRCDLIWFENLNLSRCSCKPDILNWVQRKYPNYYHVYDEIYNKGDKSYFYDLRKRIQSLSELYDCPLYDNYTPYFKAEPGHPIFVDYLFHEEVKGTNNSGIRNK